ncbi:DUF2635 domain-containing protein [Bradyrhizobium cenepequi]
MTDYVFAKPREGGRVRRPDQNFRPMREEGESVPCIDYYNRLLIAGDLVLCDPPADAASVPDTPNIDPKPEPAQAKPSRSTKEH